MIITFKTKIDDGWAYVPKIGIRHIDVAEANANTKNKRTRSLINSALFNAHLYKTLDKNKIRTGEWQTVESMIKRGWVVEEGFLSIFTLELDD